MNEKISNSAVRINSASSDPGVVVAGMGALHHSAVARDHRGSQAAGAPQNREFNPADKSEEARMEFEICKEIAVNKHLIIFGSAPCTVEDMSKAPGTEGSDYMAVGLDALGKYMGEILFIASNHKEDVPLIHRIMQQRHEACGAGYQYLLIAPEQWPGVQIVEPYRPPSGSSAITGAFAAIRMGYDKIILCGCPLTGNAPAGNSYEAFRPGWETHKEVFMGKVKSMSGWTMELLGYPTEEWLNA